MTSGDEAASYCVIVKTLGCTEGLSICTGRIGCVDIDVPPYLLIMALAPLPVPLLNPKVLPPLPAVLWTPLVTPRLT